MTDTALPRPSEANVDPATDAGVPEQPAPPKTIRASPKVIAVVFVGGVLLILYAWRLWPFTSAVATTENAYVRGQITALAPQVAGYVVESDVRDFAHVRRGQVLLRIDPRIYQQQLDSARAQLQVA